MQLSTRDIERLIDFSAVSGGTGPDEVRVLAEHARARHFATAMVLPCHVATLVEQLGDHPHTLPATCIGFPSGAHTTQIKMQETRFALEAGAHEVDMVLNVGALRAGDYEYVAKDIRAVIEAAGDKIVKVILEVHYLTDDQIKKGCELCIDAHAHFVKTSTGWAPTGATMEKVALIADFVGEAINIKAAGGIRDLNTLVEMYRLGVDRFGISVDSALKVLAQCEALPGGFVDLGPGAPA